MMPAARVTDNVVCPAVTGVVPHVGGPIAMGCPTVLISMLPAARTTDTNVCVGPPGTVVMGAATVMIANMPVAKLTCTAGHGGVIVGPGCPTVIITP